MKQVATEVQTNVYLIPERLREIDRDYFVIRNHTRQVFEIHHRTQPESSYCLTVPYSELDARTLDLVRKTNIVNAEKLLLQMDEHNRKLEEAQNQIPEEAVEKTKEVFSYLNRHESKETAKGAYTTRFI